MAEIRRFFLKMMATGNFFEIIFEIALDFLEL